MNYFTFLSAYFSESIVLPEHHKILSLSNGWAALLSFYRYVISVPSWFWKSTAKLRQSLHWNIGVAVRSTLLGRLKGYFLGMLCILQYQNFRKTFFLAESVYLSLSTIENSRDREEIFGKKIFSTTPFFNIKQSNSVAFAWRKYI